MFHFLSKNSFSYGHNPTLPSQIQLAVDQQDHTQLVSKITDFSFDICKFFCSHDILFLFTNYRLLELFGKQEPLKKHISTYLWA